MIIKRRLKYYSIISLIALCSTHSHVEMLQRLALRHRARLKQLKASSLRHAPQVIPQAIWNSIWLTATTLTAEQILSREKLPLPTPNTTQSGPTGVHP